MAEEYLHGAYGHIEAVGIKVPEESQIGIVYVGTAPVHTIEGGAKNVNRPIVVNNIGEARRYFGYSEDYAGYTLCEPMHVHLERKGVGPLIFINVLDPEKHKGDEGGNISMTPQKGKIVIPGAGNITLDSIVIKTTDEEPAEKKKGEDYTVAYSISKQTITITEAAKGKLGDKALTITYDTVDPSKVENEDVIGTTDGMGLNTGLYALKDVYQVTGFIPSFLVCPGFSSIEEIHSAMYENSVKINKHWDMFMFSDLPITDKGEAVTLDTAYKVKKANGYIYENEKVFFPIVSGIDGKKYHLSVLATANFQELLIENEGIPYMSSSNTNCDLIEDLYLGEEYKGRIIDDSIINEKLNKNGIASAAYVGGRWAIWGAHTAEYDQIEQTQINVAETVLMMLYYISNDFQHRHTPDVDQPLTPNDIKRLVSDEQTRLDALVKTGALTYGEVHMNDDTQARSDILMGDYTFSFNVTTVPLAKSLTANVVWTDDGFVTYFETGESGSAE